VRRLADAAGVGVRFAAWYAFATMSGAPAIVRRVLEIEDHALFAWPAADVEPDEGWFLRAMGGVSHRANSVWTARATGLRSLGQRIARAESFYRARQLVPTFQVGTESRPLELDAELAARGYVVEAPVAVQVAESAHVARGPCVVEVEVRDQLTDDWFELSGRRGRFASVHGIYRGLLQRIGERALFAAARVEGDVAAVGLGVRGSGWLGISSMFTSPAYRRQGAAGSILSALATHAASECRNIYLQVERDNVPARRLYHAAGFTDHHGYHYRVAR